MKTTEIREINYGTKEYAEEIKLRSRILREPLGLEFTPEELASDAHDLHLGAYDQARLIGCLILTKLNAETAKMRQVAVEEDYQGSGVGRQLIEAFEARALDLGFRKIELSARENALPFYEKMGYEIASPPMMEVRIPHRKMKKSLSQKI